MTDAKKYYDEHCVSMEKAAAAIESGDTIWMGSTLCVSGDFLDALADRADELHDVTIIANMFLTPSKIMMDPKYKKSFHTITIFANVFERMAAKQNNIDFCPIPYGQLVEGVVDAYKCNVVCVEVSALCDGSSFDTGILGTNFTPTIMRRSEIKKRIAIVNEHQPPAHGDKSITRYPVDIFDFIVENPHDIPSLPISEPSDKDRAIAANITPYINDGDSIQIGMGGLGNEVAKELIHKKELEVFTEIGTDAMIDLVEKGVVKKIRMVGAFGSKELYHWLGGRGDIVTLLDVKDVLLPESVAKVDNIVAINSTFQIDVTGQACSEAQGVRQYSGVGGSYAFLCGAPKAKNGRSFLCLRSTFTDKSGKVHSNIHAALPEGSVVTTSRYFVQYVVTEYGVADVYLKSIKDRIRAIIPIAHPDFREELKKQTVELGLMGPEDFG